MNSNHPLIPSPHLAVWITSDTVSGWNFGAAEARLLHRVRPALKLTVCASEAEFLAALPSADIAAVWHFQQSYFASATRLKWLATPAAGKDCFAIEPPPGVRVTYGHFHGEIIAETVLGMMLGHCRGLFDCQQLMSTRAWPRAELAARMRPLRGAHVAILGFGRIGAAIGALAKPFGVRLTGCKRQPDIPRPNYFAAADRLLDIAAMDAILPTVDHLVLALPRSPSTDRLLDRRRLALLPRHAAVYNIGRGNAIDETALAEALTNGTIARACLDVFENEPLPEDSPLRRCPTAFLMPHASAISPNYLHLFCHELAAAEEWSALTV